MTVPQNIQLRLALQIRVCDDVIEQLAQLDSRQLTDLIEDVQGFRARLIQRLTSMDGGGSMPSA